MGRIVGQIEESTKVFTGILVLGLVGLLFLIVFGNLSGNLGFSDDTITVTNESGHFINATTDTLDVAGLTNFTSASIVDVLNATNGVAILAANYTFSSAGTIVGTAGRTENFTSVNISYTWVGTSAGETDTDNVITNLTTGANTFFTFANVWFTLLAIVILIIVVIAVISVVKIKGSKFSS